MLPTGDTLRIIWHMLAGCGTLLVFFLFAYELVRARSLAKAQQVAKARRKEIPETGLGQLADPWAPQAKSSFAKAVASGTTALNRKPYARTM